jgi:hypothetical protein
MKIRTTLCNSAVRYNMDLTTAMRAGALSLPCRYFFFFCFSCHVFWLVLPLCVVPGGNLAASFWVCFYLFFKFVHKNSYFIVVAIVSTFRIFPSRGATGNSRCWKSALPGSSSGLPSPSCLQANIEARISVCMILLQSSEFNSLLWKAPNYGTQAWNQRSNMNQQMGSRTLRLMSIAQVLGIFHGRFGHGLPLPCNALLQFSPLLY